MIDPETAGNISQKEYKDLSVQELSEIIAENKRQIAELLNLPEHNAVSHEDSTNNWTLLFQRAASLGDIFKLKEMLSNTEIMSYIDINAGDTPPLIYAACFGKIEVAELLLDAGADINIQDSFGWSALMWATNNQHLPLVQLLLDRGASPKTKSISGRTAISLNNSENFKMLDTMATSSSDSTSSRASSLFLKISTSSFSSSSEHTFDLPSFTTNINQFRWDACAYDQMFVFKEDDLNHILDLIITRFQLPLSDLENIHVPANVIFLAARYSYHFSAPEQLENLLNTSFKRIRDILCLGVQSVHFLAFWISNLTQLLFYLKKDTSLVFATIEQQLSLTELMSELYSALTRDMEKNVLQTITTAMLEYESLPDINRVQFIDSWQRFFFRKNTRLSIVRPVSTTTSPCSIIQYFSSILHVLRSYQIHSNIITQLFSQLLHFISYESFNRIITTKKYLCRSKAMQIRMNFSQLEDWISTHSFPTTVSDHLNPTMQLLQLLQCLTQLKDLLDFIQVTQKFESLNMPQIRRCVLSYRYEINEDKIPEEIEKYTIQCVQDKVKQQSFDVVRASISSGRPSISFFSRNTSISEQLPDGENKETKCTKFMLSFTVPTITQLTHEHPSLPSISPEWMIKLDKPQDEP